MPEVTVVRNIPAGTRAGTMTLKIEQWGTISMITTPPIMKGTAAAWTITETARPGLAPFSFASAPGLRTLTFDHQVAALNPYVSMEEFLNPFRQAAEQGKRVQFTGGGWLPSDVWWWVRGLSITEDEKAANNQTSRATLSWDCVAANTISAVELTKIKVKTTGPSNPIDKKIKDARDRGAK